MTPIECAVRNIVESECEAYFQQGEEGAKTFGGLFIFRDDKTYWIGFLCLDGSRSYVWTSKESFESLKKDWTS